MDYEFCVFIGRFQGFHLAHLAVLRHALSTAQMVIVVIGSARAANNIKNPWTSEERHQMISDSLTVQELSRVRFVYVRDYLYNENFWISDVQQKVIELTGGSSSVAITGSYKDSSSYYIRLFPQWDFMPPKHHEVMNATEIRRELFGGSGSLSDDTATLLPEPVTNWLRSDYLGSKRHHDMQDEQRFINEYRAKWANAPFMPTFNTVDAVVVQSGHVLVVKRKFQPGKGQWALPGGFLKQDETLRAAAIRELKEETRIKVSKEDLDKYIRANKVFDHPDRSLRGRTITQAYYVVLPDGPLPEIKGGDDAESAKWLPLMDANQQESNFYEDHYHIINHFVSSYTRDR